MTDSHTLYGTPLSLYTGKARSYLIKNRLPYREITSTTDHYTQRVLPLAGLRTLPTLETRDGAVIRDSTAIIDHFEAEAGHPASPTSPCQRIISRLFDAMGSEGLLRPAMHYRWNFPKENLEFLAFHFQTLIPGDRDRIEGARKNMDRMRQAGAAFGATPDRFALIEELYQQLIHAFDQHFGQSPYLLGDRPCIGDFGLMAPMYAHLGRDPKPLSLMQAQAIHLFRWVERMNRPEPDIGEFVARDDAPAEPSFAPDDAVPESLKTVLRQLAIDFVPETLAAAARIDDWLDTQADLPSGTPIQRGVGMADFEVAGVKMSALAQPYRFYLLQRLHADFDGMSAEQQSQVERMLGECSLLPILSARVSREIGRANNLEVWC